MTKPLNTLDESISAFGHLNPHIDVSRLNSTNLFTSNFNDNDCKRKSRVFRQAEGILTYARGCRLPWLHESGNTVPRDEDGEENDEASFSSFSRSACLMNHKEALAQNAGFARLVLGIEEARQLGMDDPLGPEEVSAFVRVSLDGVRLFDSSTVPRTPNPVWDSEVAMFVHRPSSILKLEVFDFDPEVEGHDHLLGFVELPLSMLRRGTTEEAWIPLLPGSHHAASTGVSAPGGLSGLSPANVSFSKLAQGAASAGAIRVAVHLELVGGIGCELFAHALPAANANASTSARARSSSAAEQDAPLDVSELYSTCRAAARVWWYGVLSPLLQGAKAVFYWRSSVMSLLVAVAAATFVLAPSTRFIVLLSALVAVFMNFPPDCLPKDIYTQYVKPMQYDEGEFAKAKAAGKAQGEFAAGGDAANQGASANANDSANKVTKRRLKRQQQYDEADVATTVNVSHETAPAPAAASSNEASAALQALSALLPNSSLLRTSLSECLPPAQALLRWGLMAHSLLARRSRAHSYVHGVVALSCAVTFVLKDIANEVLTYALLAAVLSVLLMHSPIGRFLRAVFGFFSDAGRAKGIKQIVLSQQTGGGLKPRGGIKGMQDQIRRRLREKDE